MGYQFENGMGYGMGYGVGGIAMLLGTVLMGLAIVALVKYVRN